jgi:hypothetical protein
MIAQRSLVLARQKGEARIRDSSLQQLSLRMTRMAGCIFCVILSAAKDLARQRVSLQHRRAGMQSGKVPKVSRAR